MFLNKKSLTKIRLLTGAYLVLSASCFLIAILFSAWQIEYKSHIFLGCLSLALMPIFYKIGHFSEGKGKLITKGNQLICHQLRPAEFVRLYEEKRDDPTNVIAKPDYDVLRLLLTAYDALEDTDSALEIIDQMIQIAPAKKVHETMLLKASLLFSIKNRTQEAEAIYTDVVSAELGMLGKVLADAVMKSDRAMAFGDDATAEIFLKQSLTQKFPKPTPMSRLSAHYHLAGICYRANRLEEAEAHRKYCIENGGQTGIQAKAVKGDIFQ